MNPEYPKCWDYPQAMLHFLILSHIDSQHKPCRDQFYKSRAEILLHGLKVCQWI